MWIDTRDCVPLEDGYYLVQTVYGETWGYQYTHAGGWNTFCVDGELHANSAINDGYVARWYKAEAPKAVPEEWVDEYTERG